MMKERERSGADDEVVQARLHAFNLVELLAEGHEIRDVIIDGQIEMRDRAGRFGEAFGDGAAHRGEWNGFLLESRGRTRRRGRRRSTELLYVVGDDSPARA